MFLNLIKLLRIPQNCFLHILVQVTFIAIRVAALVLTVKCILIDQAVPLIGKIAFLIKTNWWHSRFEDFWTNESMLNCLLCWAIWLAYVVMLTAIVFFPVMVVIMLFEAFYQNGFCAMLRYFCYIVKIVGVIVFRLSKS